MINAISRSVHPDPINSIKSQPAAKPPSSSQNSNPSSTPTKASIPQDTVQLSTAAQTPLQESLETPAQTLQEAGNGDRQAQALLAREVTAQTAS